MKTTIALLFIVVAVLCANGQASLSPSPPVIPETFSTQFRTNVQESEHVEGIHYIGEIYSDFVEKRYLSVITSIFKDPNLPERHEWSLELFKTKETYVFEWEGDSSKPSGPCNKKTNSGIMKPQFAWTKSTNYSNTVTIDNRRIDIFTVWMNDTQMSVGVAQGTKDVPYLTSQRLENFYINYYFHDFDPTPPAATTFTIPSECRRKY